MTKKTRRTTSRSERRSRPPLSYFLGLDYPVTVRKLARDEGGGYFAEVKDLPGCFSDAGSWRELPARIDAARTLWLETAYEAGRDIPLPSTHPNRFSGR